MKCLFEDYENQTEELNNILSKYEYEDNTYQMLEKLHKEVNEIGYTFDSYLDAEPYGLRPIGIELNQLEGFEDIDN